MPPSPRAPDLFDAAASAALERAGPLAARLRPQNLDEVIGQSHLLAKGAALRALIEADRLSSAIFFGPPGTGKTSVARLAALASKKAFVQLSAVAAGVKEVRETLEQARQHLGQSGQGTLLFLDEIHRFSRTQQDALLPGVEEGVIVLLGATTENPFFSLSAPLLSRSSLWRFEALSNDELAEVIRRAASWENTAIDDEALAACVDLSDGDARSALTTFEIALAISEVRSKNEMTEGEKATPRVTREDIEAARTTRAIRHGRDEHYDLISALIKSVRGSDPQAGIYWLARLLAAGTDPRFVARRLVILASEDVGLADPIALVVAQAAADALDRVGLPEAGLNLAEAVIYLSSAPKSNRVAAAYWAAEADVASAPLGAVPPSLRDAHYQGAASLGHGAGYEYPHDDPAGFVHANYLPVELAGRRYYEPSDHGAEAAVKAHLSKLWSKERTSDGDEQEGDGEIAQ